MAKGGSNCTADSMASATNEGYRTIRELALAKQVLYSPACTGDDARTALRAIGEIELSASFPIRSAMIFWAHGAEVKGRLYDEPIRDGLPHGRSLEFTFQKDMRRKDTFWFRGGGEPVDTGTYGRWMLLPPSKRD